MPSQAASAPDLAPRWVEWGLVVVLLVLLAREGFLPAWATLNTDFPNYYIGGWLFRNGYSLERAADWIWFGRHRDHLGLTGSVAAFSPLTPYSALVVAPLTLLPALVAKRCWLVLMAGQLAGTGWLLRAVTGMPARRVALLILLSIKPLQSGLLYGQQHVLVLFLLSLAAWLYLRGRPGWSGATVAVAAVLKLYPALFLLFFLRKRQWRAVAGLCAGLLVLGLVGVALFGFETLYVYAVEVAPRTLRGECNDPYTVLFNSPTALLRRLLVVEPSLNPHPLAHVPEVFAVLQPLAQALLLVPGLWWLTAGRADAARERLEWGGYVALLLILSVGSATYHYCVLILAAALIAGALLDAHRVGAARLVVACHALVCFPLYEVLPMPSTLDGWSALRAMPRLFAMLAFWALVCWTLRRRSAERRRSLILLFAVLVIVGGVSNARHLRGQFTNYAARLQPTDAALIATAPAIAGREVTFARLTDDGYTLDRTGRPLDAWLPPGQDLFHPTFATRRSLADDAGIGWVEVAGLRSRVARFPVTASVLWPFDLPTEIDDAQQPVVSADDAWLGFLRERPSGGALWLQERATGLLRPLVARPSLDVRDFGFFPDNRVILAAQQGSQSRLLVVEPPPAGAAQGGEAPLTEFPTAARPARYPAVSPDGAWLVYSARQAGAWQLWLARLPAGEQRQLTSADCNSVMAQWQSDSKTLIYGTDCGRALNHTALCWLRAVP